MPVWIDPTGRSTYGIGICARCSRKFPLEHLHSDPNTPGLKVCLDDLDQYDPYRLPARRTEDVTLRFFRPDVRLDAGGAIPNTTSLFGVRSTETGGNLRVTSGGDLRVIASIAPFDGT
jgi:hypothetical protein